jgi:hypothetical protein
MTGSAVRSVPLDWQGPVGSSAQAASVATGVAAQPGILQASPAATAPFSAASHTGEAGTTAAGSGSILAVPQDYQSHIRTFRFLQGSLRPGGIVLDQQLAATLQAKLGDRVAITLPASEPAARPGAGPAARQRGDHAARHVRGDDRSHAAGDPARGDRLRGRARSAERGAVAGTGAG